EPARGTREGRAFPARLAARGSGGPRDVGMRGGFCRAATKRARVRAGGLAAGQRGRCNASRAPLLRGANGSQARSVPPFLPRSCKGGSCLRCLKAEWGSI